jgi:hypothetical protein
MTEIGRRLTDGMHEPDEKEVSGWIGAANYKMWKKVIHYIEINYPGVFDPEWLYGGKKHGWSLRFKKSKSFCTLIPGKQRFDILIVFGAEERQKAEALLARLTPRTRKAYTAAATFHDGKWLWFAIDDEKLLEDVKLLLTAKRRPKPAANEKPRAKS